MNSRLVKICGLGALLVCLTGVDAQAGGRRHCHCQPQYVAAAPAATPTTASTADGRVQYQSAYQAPAAPAQGYYYNNGGSNGYRSSSNRWDAQQHFARHIKGLE